MLYRKSVIKNWPRPRYCENGFWSRRNFYLESHRNNYYRILSSFSKSCICSQQGAELDEKHQVQKSGHSWEHIEWALNMKLLLFFGSFRRSEPSTWGVPILFETLRCFSWVKRVKYRNFHAENPYGHISGWKTDCMSTAEEATQQLQVDKAGFPHVLFQGYGDGQTWRSCQQITV